MEDEEQGFKRVKIGIATTETGEERYYQNDILEKPAVAHWRINITALSQVYNLYFIAAGHEVHVYEPQFPFQKLGGVPALRILPQLANPQAQGYIDLLEKHNINHLTIGNLGNQEILLLSTDSGNVAAYFTSLIKSAIECLREASPPEISAVETDRVRPFFSHWVRYSAWGLSIHSRGRMIAVSSNAPDDGSLDEPRGDITIFAFALAQISETNEEREEQIDDSRNYSEWDMWDPAFPDIDASLPNRGKNFKIVLAGYHGHTANIPCVSFINTSDDPYAFFILSTDITGVVKLWNIWTGNCIKTWHYENDTTSTRAVFQDPDRGWIVSPIDVRAFLPVSSTENLVGYPRVSQHFGFHSQGASFDISSIVRLHVPSNNPFKALGVDTDESSSDDEVEEQFYEIMSDSQIDAEESHTTQATTGDTSTPSRSVQTEQDTESLSADQIAQDLRSIDDHVLNEEIWDVGTEDELEDDDDDDDDDDDQSAIAADIYDYRTFNPSTGVLVQISDQLNRSFNHGSISALHPQPLHQVQPLENGPSSAALQSKVLDREIPDLPFLYCSSSHLRLFSSVKAPYPHLFCARLLRQQILRVNWWMERNDRLDRILQIPHLNLLILASPTGRCAVCTLTKRRSDAVVALRVDWVLPTRKQERAGLRPSCPLLGIAASPIQGQFEQEMAQPAYVPNAWAQDSSINNAPDNFDENFVDSESLAAEDVSLDDEIAYDSILSPKNPKGTTATNFDDPGGRNSNKSHSWTQKKSTAPWVVSGEGRSYRLMLTYADLTVLTYELSRSLETYN